MIFIYDVVKDMRKKELDKFLQGYFTRPDGTIVVIIKRDTPEDIKKELKKEFVVIEDEAFLAYK